MMTVHVVGLGLGPNDLSPKLLAVVESAGALAGGTRHLDFFPRHTGIRIPLTGKLSDWLDRVERAAAERTVAVLASGDPGFHGIAARIVERLGADDVVVHPNVSSVQAAFARLKEPWHDAVLVSLHGHDEQFLLGSLYRTDKIAVLTDPSHTPARIAQLLLDRGQNYWRMWVLEDLGTDRERVGSYTLEDAAAASFSPLNVVVLKREKHPEALWLGTPEERFAHEAGLITKSEIRPSIIAALNIRDGQVMWDLGAGCGSVGIEASLINPTGRIVAVERSTERIRHIEENRARFGVANLEIVRAELPEGMGALPAPDRIFIGGGGRNLSDILRRAAKRLPPGGVIVTAAVRLESVHDAQSTLLECGFAVDLIHLHVDKSNPLGGGLYMKPLNPVWIVRGTQTEKG